jgi:predicted phage terminase large subunit-like protein|tara:strand:+ start:1951 stop:3432 length:1482 start_codon:yes stop_codon:yes gene_type:complete
MNDTSPGMTATVPEDRLKLYASLLGRARVLEKAEKSKDDFLSFVKETWPDFIQGRHHKIMAEKFTALAEGKLKRLIVNMPPRHTKSEFASYMLPAWLMGRNPNLKIMQTTHTAELAFRFGRKVRNLMNTEDYTSIFQDVKLRADSQAAGRWETDSGGEYFAAGVGGAVTGRGADLLIIDDPHSEQDALSSTALENAYEWYTSGPRQRLQPGGSIVIVMTRWAENDLTGKLIRQQARDDMADKWEVVEFPALMPETDKPLWPEFWSEKDLLGVKGSLSVGKWEAQWQQNPTSEASAILKREWWQKWEPKELPALEYIMQSYDTAFSKQTTADYSAITTWGVFYPEEGGPANIILADARRGRWDFPDLRRKAFEEYEYWDPECVLIEAKASGMPLTQELRTMGIPVVNYSPSRGNDKITRVNSVAPMFESGLVWAPETRWAEEVIEECAAFPAGENDDYVDTVAQALRRFREGGFIIHPEDYEEEDRLPKQRIYY